MRMRLCPSEGSEGHRDHFTLRVAIITKIAKHSGCLYHMFFVPQLIENLDYERINMPKGGVELG